MTPTQLSCCPPPNPPSQPDIAFYAELTSLHGPLFSTGEREKKTKKTLLINFLSTANADRAGFWDGFRSAGTFEKWRESKRSVNTSLKSSCWSFFSFFFFFFVNWCTVILLRSLGWRHQSHWMCSRFVPAVCLYVCMCLLMHVRSVRLFESFRFSCAFCVDG